MGPWGYSKSSKSWTTLGSLRSPSRRTIADSFQQHGRRSLGFRLNGGNQEAWSCSVEQTAWGCTQSGKPGNGITQLDLLRCYYYIRSAISPGVPGHASNVDETMFYFPETILFRFRDDTYKIASCWIYCHDRNECSCFFPSNLIFDGSKVQSFTVFQGVPTLFTLVIFGPMALTAT